MGEKVSKKTKSRGTQPVDTADGSTKKKKKSSVSGDGSSKTEKQSSDSSSDSDSSSSSSASSSPRAASQISDKQFDNFMAQVRTRLEAARNIESSENQMKQIIDNIQKKIPCRATALKLIEKLEQEFPSGSTP